MAQIVDIDAARILAEREDRARIVVDCGHVANPDFFLVPDWRKYADTPGKGVTGFPGYGTDKDGKRLCYACIGRNEIESLRTENKIVAYLASDNKTVTNWPGTKLGTVTYVNVPKAARKVFVRVTDVHGGLWYGQGPAESGTYVSLRKAKG
jgi:hypothetical protein